MSTVVALPKSTDQTEWTAEEKAVIEAAGLVFKHAYGPKEGQVELAPRAVVAKFKHTCERTGLDPLARQIYAIGRYSKGNVEWAIQTAIDGFRVIAERSKKYAGQDPAEWLTANGEWVSVFVKAIHGEHPLAARVNVHRTDWPGKPAVGIATWDEYAQTTLKGELTAMWKQRGPGQLAKCAEALAMRKAFPQDLSGLFTDDESYVLNTEPEREKSGRDWEAEIDGAQNVDDINLIASALKKSGEGTDALRLKYAARLGVLQAEEHTVDAEEVNDDEPATPTESVSGASGALVADAAGDPAGDGAVDQGGERLAGNDAGRLVGDQSA